MKKIKKERKKERGRTERSWRKKKKAWRRKRKEKERKRKKSPPMTIELQQVFVMGPTNCILLPNCH